MAAPGTTILSREAPPQRTAPTDTDTWFVAGLTEKGPLEPILVQSMDDYADELGSRVSYGQLYDALDVFFREGGARAYVSRVVGDTPVAAFKVLNDSVPAATLRVEANSPGDWGNALNVAILAGDAGGEFKIQVSHDTLGILETSPSLVDKTAAFAWAEGSDWIVLVDQASANDPAVVAAQSLTSGTDDRGTVVDANWATALDRFGTDLGPGQVSMPGRTTDQSHIDTLAHAAARNRIALLDAPDTPTKATLTASAVAARNNGRYGGLFAPWAIVPAVPAGTTRVVPYSAVQAGIIARNDSANSPNKPAAGELGQSLYALGLSQPAWDDQDRSDLNDAGVNIARVLYGGVRTYGWRTLQDPQTDPNWIYLGNSRLFMGIAAKGNEIGERYVFRQLDGRGITISDFGGDLTGMLIPYFSEGSLYGATADEAFVVDVGPTVNTTASLAAGELHAVLSLRMSPDAERVILEIVKKPITQSVV